MKVTKLAKDWNHRYMQFLTEQGIDEKQIPYFARWLNSFFNRYKGKSTDELGRKEIERYLSELIKRPQIQLWQVEQARQAIELYYEKFLRIPLEPRGSLEDQHHVGMNTNIDQQIFMSKEAPTWHN